MLVTIKLTAIPFVAPAVLQCGTQYIKLNPEKETLKFYVVGASRKRIALDVCNFMNKIFKEPPTEFLDTSKLASTLRAWFKKVCLHSFRCYANESQKLFEDDAIVEGRRLVLEALGLAKPNGIAPAESEASNSLEQLVSAMAAQKVAQYVEKNSIRLPIGNGRQIELVIPTDLTSAEAYLIASASLEYFKHLIITQYKK